MSNNGIVFFWCRIFLRTMFSASVNFLILSATAETIIVLTNVQLYANECAKRMEFFFEL